MAGRITALKAQAKNRGRVNVYLDGAFAFALSDLVAATLRVGQWLSDEEIADLQQRQAAQRAYDRALRFLSYRPRSVDEVNRYLAGKQVPDDLIAQTVDRLQQAGLLDDETFARFWVENRESFRPRGKAALRYELRRKGLGEEAIQAAIQDVDESEGAYRIAQAQAQRLAGVDRQAFRQRLGGYLSRRGFSYGVIRETIERLWQERATRQSAEGSKPSEGSRR